MKNMKAFFLLMFLFTANLAFAQISFADLPDIKTIDSVRVKKVKENPTDTVRKVQFINISYRQMSNGGIDTVVNKTALFDSLQLVNVLYQKIENENKLAADATYLWANAQQNAKGLGVYIKAIQRITKSTYYALSWKKNKAAYVGKWVMISNVVPNHTFTVTIDQVAERDKPLANGQTNYDGTFRVLAPNRIQLSGYSNKFNDVFDLIDATSGIFMSLDGSTKIQRIQ